MASRVSYAHATTCGGYIARTGTEQHCETLSSGPRPLGIDSLDAVVRAGLVTTRLALSFLARRETSEAGRSADPQAAPLRLPHTDHHAESD
jgi:hypothetical protein